MLGEVESKVASLPVNIHRVAVDCHAAYIRGDVVEGEDRTGDRSTDGLPARSVRLRTVRAGAESDTMHPVVYLGGMVAADGPRRQADDNEGP